MSLSCDAGTPDGHALPWGAHLKGKPINRPEWKLAQEGLRQPEQAELPEPMGMIQPKTRGANTAYLDAQEETWRALQKKDITCG